MGRYAYIIKNRGARRTTKTCPFCRSLTHYAGLYGIDLSASFAYADSHVDLPMLRSVGNPVAVSPDIGLMRAAKESGWSIIEWPSHALQPRWKLPS